MLLALSYTTVAFLTLVHRALACKVFTNITLLVLVLPCVTLNCILLPSKIPPSPHLPYLSIQGIFHLLAVPNPICPPDWLIPKVIPSFLHQLSQRIRFPDPVPPAVILVNRALPTVRFRLIPIWRNLLNQLVIPVIHIARHGSSRRNLMGHPVLPVKLIESFQFVGICSLYTLSDTISCRIIVILCPLVNPILFVQYLPLYHPVVCIITVMDLRPFGHDYLNHIPIGVIFILSNSRPYRPIPLNGLLLLDSPPALVILVPDLPPDPVFYHLFFQGSVPQTVILIPSLCPKIILHTGQMVILIISKSNPVPAGRLLILHHLILPISFLCLIPLQIILITDYPVPGVIIFLSYTHLFPYLQPQSVISIQGFLPFSVLLPDYLAMAVVFILLKLVPFRILDAAQAACPIVCVDNPLTIIPPRVISLRQHLAD